ncbi:hypothetical protein J3F83DRAFT_728967 [Trichoderma novae-zelandiae]
MSERGPEWQTGSDGCAGRVRTRKYLVNLVSRSHKESRSRLAIGRNWASSQARTSLRPTLRGTGLWKLPDWAWAHTRPTSARGAAKRWLCVAERRIIRWNPLFFRIRLDGCHDGGCYKEWHMYNYRETMRISPNLPNKQAGPSGSRGGTAYALIQVVFVCRYLLVHVHAGARHTRTQAPPCAATNKVLVGTQYGDAIKRQEAPNYHHLDASTALYLEPLLVQSCHEHHTW